MSSDKGISKDISNFHQLCKGLYKYIQRKIIKQYVNPNMSKSEINPYNSIQKPIEEEKDKQWTYYKKENLTEEEKILDAFKDNVFLGKIQKCYEALEIVNNYLDENIKNIQFLHKNIEVGEKKIELLSQLNTQLNQFFKQNENSIQNQNNNNNDSNNNNNVLGRLNLVKSLNILNDLQIMNSINDVNKQDNINNINNTNTTITNNNNIILDNKIINNNINKEKMGIISEDIKKNNFYEDGYDNKNKCDYNLTPQFLNKKSKRIKNDDEEFINIPNNNNNQEYNKGKNDFPRNNNKFNNLLKNKKKKFYNNKNKSNNNINTPSNNISINNDNDNVNDNVNDNKNDIPEDNEILEQNFSFKQDISLDESINKEKSIIQNEKENEKEKEKVKVKEKEKENLNEKKLEEENNIINNDDNNNDNTLEIEFEKVLKKEFSSIYFNSNSQKNDSKREIIKEIVLILKKIKNIRFNQKDKFDEPYLVGSYSRFNIAYLLDYLPPIDILFKCINIKSLDELKYIASETMQKKICLKYIEISNDYDKKNEIVKIGNKCKIKINNNDDFFIHINLFFVGINLNNFIQKEKSINRFFFSNNMTDNKGKILISLFFRRWRRKYKLFFIMPEFLDVIINFYFNEKESLALIIEKIFYDLFNGEINLCSKDNNNVYKDEDNIKAISGFVDEWFKSNEDRKSLNNAIITTQEFIMKNDFYSTFKNE